MSITRDVFLQALSFLFPAVCLACGEVEGLESLPLGLCRGCRDRLRDIRSIPSERRLESRQPSPSLNGLLTVWAYQPPLEAVIHALKFGRMEFLGRDLAAALHRCFGDALQEVDVVVPVPLHWFRRCKRGYNQAETIAAPLAKRLGLPLVRAMRRRRATRPQARLNRAAREDNLRLAFAVARAHRPEIADRRILLVDDVVTTGATIEAAAACLRSSGARTVTAAAAGCTPLPDRSPAKGGPREAFDRGEKNSI